MVKRYGKEITGNCAICLDCGRKTRGKTQIHHIISQAKISRLEQGDHGFDMNLERNNGNLVELCVECHDLTDSSAFRRWRINQEGKTRSKGITKLLGLPAKDRVELWQFLLREWESMDNNTCRGITSNWRRCKNSEDLVDGFCEHHFQQSTSWKKGIGKKEL